MYAESINLYLADNHFQSIFLIGGSEGAIIIPALYAKINEKETIKGIISFAGGGLSMYDSGSLLSTSKRTPSGVRKEFAYTIENYDTGIEGWSHSIGVDKYGNVLRWLTSAMEFKPFEYWRNIDIPVLFLHGEKDYNVAVESTRCIQDNLPDKPFEFIYYKDMAHSPSPLPFFHEFQLSRMQNDITKWMRKVQDAG